MTKDSLLRGQSKLGVSYIDKPQRGPRGQKTASDGVNGRLVKTFPKSNVSNAEM